MTQPLKTSVPPCLRGDNFVELADAIVAKLPVDTEILAGPSGESIVVVAVFTTEARSTRRRKEVWKYLRGWPASLFPVRSKQLEAKLAIAASWPEFFTATRYVAAEHKLVQPFVEGFHPRSDECNLVADRLRRRGIDYVTDLGPKNIIVTPIGQRRIIDFTPDLSRYSIAHN